MTVSTNRTYDSKPNNILLIELNIYMYVSDFKYLLRQKAYSKIHSLLIICQDPCLVSTGSITFTETYCKAL